ncbi:MAG: YfiR family protein [Rubrivivax sp.]|nr:MAG: YfiR family protein [Rubrivivax sp.]
MKTPDLPRTLRTSPPRRSSELIRAVRTWVLGALLTGLVLGAVAGQPEVVEYQIKAAFLYKFGTYVQWPDQAFAQADSPLTIGVMGADTVADELVQISTGRTVNGHPVNVKRLHRGDPISGLHILFVARPDNGKLADILLAAKGQPILVVTETEPPPMPGSMINFVVAGDKVRFDIALPSAEAGNLKLSARLLTVARKVIGAPS